LPVFLPVGKDKKGNQKWIFLISPTGARADVEVWYWIGEFDRKNFRFIPDNEKPEKIDIGDSHFTGPSGFVDPKTGRTIIFTITQDKRNSFQQYMAGWAHNAGLPIVTSLNEDGKLLVVPINEVEKLREEELIKIENKNMEVVNDIIKDIKGDMLEIVVELEPIDAKKFGINVRCSPDHEEETFIFYDVDKKFLGVDRTKTSVDVFSPSYGIQGEFLDLNGNNIRLHIFLDHSMLEVYINEIKSLTTRVYPYRGDSLGLQISGDGGLIVKKLEIWNLKPIK
jgi:sucrose-6-phosphate hydrolase SacC (GH32 family)